MKFVKNTMKVIISIIVIILYFGCNHENPVNSEGKVHGKLIDVYNGFPLIYERISLNSAPIAIPNAYGEFYFENVSIPFDLNVFLRLGSGDLTIFKDIRNRSPIIQSGGYREGRTFRTMIKILDYNYPKLIIAKFISKSIYEDGLINYDRRGNDLIVTYDINIPATETTISGKFIVLECTTINHNITSFSNYAEKSYTVGLNSKDTLIFEREDFNFNPVESNVLVRIENNPNVYDSFIDVYIDFSDYYYDSKLYLYSKDTRQNLTYDLLVPESLPINFKIRAENRSSQIQDSSYISFNKWIYLYPSEYGEIIYYSSFGLSYPAINQMNVGRDTRFVVQDESSRAVYKFRFKKESSLNYTEVFTDSKEVTLPHLNDLGFTFIPNTEYEWYAEKYTSFESIDDFVSSPYNERKENGSKIESERRKFRTSPNY